jgi:CBS domain-containing protein
VELELGVAKALHQKLILEEPRPVVLSVTAPVIQQQAARSGKVQVPGDLDPVTPVASREAASQKSKRTTAKKVTGSERPVSKLRPKPPITMLDTDTIHAVAEAMASRRADAALLIDSKGQLSGIITDNDITRRVVSQFVDPKITCVDVVMTKNPKCVQEDDSALDALEMMVDNRFRHLPVMDKKGTVMGLLDIAKCLYDAISALERVQVDSEVSGSEKTSATAVSDAMMMAMKAAGSSSKKGNKLQMEAMQALMESMFGGAVPTLKTIIGLDKIPRLLPTQSVRDASILMAAVRKGILVMSADDKLVGILTPKDLLSRVTAKGLNPDNVTLADVMTPNPETVVSDLTLLDALKEMHDQKFLHLPVRDGSSGAIVGLVDVMELVCSTAGGEEGGKGWRDFFSGAMAAGGGGSQSGSESAHSDNSRRLGTGRKLTKRDYEDTSDIYPVESNKQTPRAGYSHNFETGSVSYVAEFAFKVTDSMGNVHRLKSSAESLHQLKIAVGEKLNALSSALVLRYLDDDKEHVVLSSDGSLRDAVDFAKQAGMSALKLTASVTTLMVTPTRGDRMLTDGKADYPTTETPVYNGILSKSTKEKNTLIMIGGGVAAVLAIGAFVFMKSRK